MCSVANLLTNTLRSTDVVARVSGDEFAIFLPDIEAHHAHVLLEKIRMPLQQLLDFEDLPISASIGAGAYASVPSALKDMMKEADAHIYPVKAAGKNRVNVKSSADPGHSASA
jgi:diguanylate cyclase (GGDEF)-like protein